MESYRVTLIRGIVVLGMAISFFLAGVAAAHDEDAPWPPGSMPPVMPAAPVEDDIGLGDAVGPPAPPVATPGGPGTPSDGWEVRPA